MIYAALRIFGHGEIGPEIATISVTTPTTTSATITTGATSEWVDAEWSYVLVRGCTEIPDGRYPILSSTSTTVTIRVTGATAGSSGTGTVAIDDCYVFCNSIPPGVGTKTATRWFDCMIDGGLSADLGAQIKPTGGISDADGVDVSLAYWQDAPVAALLRQIPAAILDADGSTLRLSQSITSTTATSINVGIPDPINPQPLTVPSVITIDGEAMGYVANPSTGVLTVARGVLGTRATGHAIGVPVFLGMASPVGRNCTVTIYRDPEDASDRLTEVSGQITIPSASNGVTQINLPISTDLILPIKLSVSELGLTTCKFLGFVDGKFILQIAQADPASVWSWVRFSDVAVRIRRAPAYDADSPDLQSLGYSLIGYQLPNGLNRYCVTAATPEINAEDAAMLLNFEGFEPLWDLYDNGLVTENDLLNAGVGRFAQLKEQGALWTLPNGQFRKWSDALYYKFTPRPIHIVEPPGAHKYAIQDAQFLLVERSLPNPVLAGNLDPGEVILQVFTSTGGTATGDGGQNGAYDLLPAELGMGIPLSRINTSKLARAVVDTVDLVVLDPADKSIADQITKQVLEPAAIGICQSTAGGVIVSGVVSDFSNLTTLITDDSIYCEGENPPQVDGPEAAVGWLVSSFVTEVHEIIAPAYFDPESRKAIYLESNGAGITAGGSIYGRTQGSSIKTDLVSYSTDTADRLVPQAVIATYGTLRQRLVIPVIGPAELLECGDVVGVSLTQVPGVNGQRGFSGAALVTDRKYDRQSGLISLGLLLFDGVPPFRSWAPGGDVAFVNDEADFTLSLVTHIPAADQKIDAFRAGDLVNIYDANYVLRSTNAPGVVATWNEATGDMTLSTAATDGSGDVLPVLGDIVVLAPVSVQTTVAADLFAYQNTSDTTTTGTRWQ